MSASAQKSMTGLSVGGRSVRRRRPDRWRTNRPAPCLPFGGKYLERVARRRIGGRAAR